MVVSVLSLAVEQALHHRPGVFRPAVIVRIDGVDVSRVDGDDGPGPWDALVPVNRFVATGEVTTATISCCPSCGPECCAIEVRIRREGATVRWDWGRRVVFWEDKGRTTLFDAAAYDAEVARVGADRSWESAVYRAGRLILADLVLPSGIVGVRVDMSDADEIEIQLEEPDAYQIWVRAAWDAERPDESAAAARAMLAGPAADWPARWFNVQSEHEVPPAYAGPSWRRTAW
ncbi:hypothetical protein AB0K00_49680 [Dactylosporangium sp. NPDC049525]|uniref:hypothetical protein n=1 Tax=Dactylosporangium sp. NPDC049525 TaxID=3154730 RepID=UPI0034445277